MRCRGMLRIASVLTEIAGLKEIFSVFPSVFGLFLVTLHIRTYVLICWLRTYKDDVVSWRMQNIVLFFNMNYSGQI